MTEKTLFVDGERAEVGGFQFETPRLVHEVTSGRPYVERQLGSPGFAINIQGTGEPPAWLDGDVHQIVVKVDGKELAPIRLALRKVGVIAGVWYGFGCIVNSEQVPTWL